MVSEESFAVLQTEGSFAGCARLIFHSQPFISSIHEARTIYVTQDDAAPGATPDGYAPFYVTN